MTAELQEAAELYAAASRRALAEPEWFYREILRYKPLPWQLRDVNAALDPLRKARGLPTVVNHEALPRVSVRSCHGTGKTEYLALVLHTWNFCVPGKALVTAPKQDQILRRLLPRYRGILRGARPEYSAWIRVLGTEICCFGDKDGGAACETASDPDNLAGYHDKPQLVLIDEAGAKRLDPMFPVIAGALTWPGSVAVEIGNPTRMEGGFYEHHNKPGVLQLYYRSHIKHEDAPGLIDQQWLDYMAATYGVDSPIYKVRVGGEFAAFDAYTLIPIDLLEDSLDTEREPDGSVPRLRVSVDVADGGADKTVATVARHYETFSQFLRQKAYSFAPSVAPIEAAEAAIRLFEAYGGDKDEDDFVVDANGVGAGCAGHLIRLGYRVIRHVGSEAAAPYKNRRTANYMAYALAHREGRIHVHPDAFDDDQAKEEYRAHALSVKRASSDKVDEIETKDKMKRDGLPSPDRADSASMQFIDREAETVIDANVGGFGQTMTGGYDAGLA